MHFYPKISIVTANYNGGEFLEQTILSVISQGYPNLEYIIIDGKSTDNSLAIIKKYDEYISYWVSEPDNGLYHAIQKGFDKSTGELMAYINSDDMYHNKSFFVISEIFSSYKQVNWLQGNPTTFDEFGRTVNVSPTKRWSKYDFFTYNYRWIQQESVFWRRCLWEAVGCKLDTSLKLAGDLDLWLRFFRHDRLYITSALIGGFRQRSKNQLSLESIDEYIDEANSRIKSEVLNTNDKCKVLVYNVLSRVVHFVGLSKIINLGFVTRGFENKYFGFPSLIYFDRLEQKFKL